MTQSNNIQSQKLDQIQREYKIRALQYHPDKCTSDPDAINKFKRIQHAKDVLTDEATRKSYDFWLNSGIHIPFEQWQAKKGHSMHWAPPRSMKLSIKQDDASGQGSDVHKVHKQSVINKDKMPQLNECGGESDLRGANWLSKFRNYEI